MAFAFAANLTMSIFTFFFQAFVLFDKADTWNISCESQGDAMSLIFRLLLSLSVCLSLCYETENVTKFTKVK